MNKTNKFTVAFFVLFFLIQIVILAIPPIFAQKIPLWVSDDFSNPASGFRVEKGEEVDYAYSEGKYYITNHAAADNFFWAKKSIFTNHDKEIIFEVEFKLLEGAKDVLSHGFSVSGKDNKTYFFKIIPKTSDFEIRYYKGKFGDLTEKKIHDDIIKKNFNETNKLWVNIKPDKIIVKINDKEIYTGNNPKDFTGTYGFFTSNAQKLEIDNFKFYEDVKINLVPNAPTNLAKENLGNKVNTKYAETSPYITPDGKTLYYCIHNSPENTGGEKDGGEIFYSESNDNGQTWTEKKNMGKPLNNDQANFVISSTPDHNTLLVGNSYKPDGSPNGGGFSITHRTKDGWEVPQKIEIEDFVSKGGTNEFCLSADRKVIIMTVLRDECIGGKDMFVTFNLGNNKWSKPKSMGKVINSVENEDTPFLAADGVTLYYASSGFPGYGSNDIFVTRRLDDTWTNWSEPQNLGQGINSNGWDAYFTLPASGNYAYMTNDLSGSLDIIRIKLTQNLKPKPVVLISGKVFNSKTKQPMSANITYNALKANKELGIATSNPTDGSYKIVLPAGEFYGFLAQKNEFISVSENIDVTKITEYKEITRNLYLSPIETGQIIRLNNVFFDFSKATLRNESFGDLDRLVKVLTENPNMNIEVGGHTDNIGTAQANTLLSQSRAQAVVNYLGQKGIAKDRISAKGYGMDKPSAVNTTEEGRQANRRVEVTILKN